jgi:hydrogenase maturation protease
MESASPDILILGIGNLLWGDEGFGVRTLEALDARYVFPENVQLVDGGTQGLYLLPYVKGARKMMIFDAVDYAMPPGTLKVVWNDQVPAFLGANKMSLHQVGFQEVLALAKLGESLPEELVLIGVQPEDMTDYGGSLKDSVRAQVPAAITVGLEVLAKWGVPGTPRDGPRDGSVLPEATGLRIDAYEAGLPTRTHLAGDARSLHTGKP